MSTVIRGESADDEAAAGLLMHMCSPIGAKGCHIRLPIRNMPMALQLAPNSAELLDVLSIRAKRRVHLLIITLCAMFVTTLLGRVARADDVVGETNIDASARAGETGADGSSGSRGSSSVSGQDLSEQSAAVAAALGAESSSTATSLSAAASTTTTHGGSTTSTSPAAAESSIAIAVVGALESDPLVGSPANITSGVMADLLWETLTSYDNVRGTVVPALAEKWTAADGYRTWQFELDPEATFSSGRPVTADDVVFTLRRVANDSQRSLFSSELMSLMKPGTTGGTIADDAVEATGARSVTVRLRMPCAELPLILANSHFGIVPAGDPRNTKASFDTSGRYRLTQSSPSTAVLTAVDPALKYQRIHVRVFGAVVDAYEAFERGEVDWSPVPGSREATALATYGQSGGSASRTMIGLSLNTGDPLLADIEVRKALMSAIDSTAVTSAAFGNRATPALSFVPREFSQSWEADACLSGCRFNEANARKALASVGLAGRSLRLDAFDTPDGRAAGVEIKRQLELVGIAVEVRFTPIDDYGNTLRRSDTQLMLTGAVSLAPSPGGFLTSAFASNGAANVTQFSSPKVDAILEKAHSTGESDERTKQFAAAERMVRQAAVVMPIAQVHTVTVFSDSVPGAWLGLDGSIHLGDGA